MAKIIEYPKIKPIKCRFCGCTYEFEIGDELKPTVIERACFNRDSEIIITDIQLTCPACLNDNSIEFVKDEEEE